MNSNYKKKHSWPMQDYETSIKDYYPPHTNNMPRCSTYPTDLFIEDLRWQTNIYLGLFPLTIFSTAYLHIIIHSEPSLAFNYLLKLFPNRHVGGSSSRRRVSSQSAPLSFLNIMR